MLERVVIYCRVSTEEEMQMNALSGQIQELTDFAHSNPEWLLIDTYVDAGKSGTRVEGRKEYQRLFNDLSLDKFDTVIVKDISRLMRSISEWCKFLGKLQQNNKKLFLYLDNGYYTSDDRLITNIKAVLADEFSHELSRKISSAAKRSQLNGTIYGNGRQLGYNQEKGKLTINEEEAVIVRMIFQWIADGYGCRRVSNKLEEMGIKSSTGTKFSTSTIKRMIRSTKYKGDVTSRTTRTDFETHKVTKTAPTEWIVHEGLCPAIVSKELWQKANDGLDGRSAQFKTGANRGVNKGNDFALSSKIYCGHCGKHYWHTNYTVKSSGKLQNIWSCSTAKSFGKDACNNITLNDEKIMPMLKEVIYNIVTDNVIESTLDVLTKALKKSKNTKPESNESDKLLSQFQKLNTRKDNLLDLLLDGTINKEQYNTKLSEIENRMSEIEKEIAKANKSNDISQMSVEERIESIRQLTKVKFKSPESITDDVVKHMIDKIVVTDENLDVYLAAGQQPTTIMYTKNNRLADVVTVGTQCNHPQVDMCGCYGLYKTQKKDEYSRIYNGILNFNVYVVV